MVCGAHFVSSWSDSSCFRCLESSFFSMERRTQALALPTSVLISLMFWMCLQVKDGEFKGCSVRVKDQSPAFSRKNWRLKKINKKTIQKIFWKKKISKWNLLLSFFIAWMIYGKSRAARGFQHRLKEMMQIGLSTPRPEITISWRPASSQHCAAASPKDNPAWLFISWQ